MCAKRMRNHDGSGGGDVLREAEEIARLLLDHVLDALGRAHGCGERRAHLLVVAEQRRGGVAAALQHVRAEAHLGDLVQLRVCYL